jgi:hypothetical protein
MEFNSLFSLTKTTLSPSKLGYYFFYYSITIILFFSGFSKIIDPENFLKVLNVTLGFLGENIIVLTATALPVFEIVLSLMLMLKTKETLIATVILFGVFLIFAIYGFISGFDVDCGCFGSNVSGEFGVGMIIRNLVFLLLPINVLFFNNRIAKND